jgi:predicted house-cleaning noncanonical NTP pyrophosphatase (MazG superfamily)
MRANKPIQVMWFCEIPEGIGIGRNIPWFMMDPPDRPPQAQAPVAPTVRRFVVRNLADLGSFPGGNCVMELEPDIGLFRDTSFLDAIAQFAVTNSVPVVLRGSVLGHAFYTLERKGVMIVASDSRRSRARRKQTFGKLVRDEIPARIEEQGELATTAKIAKSQARVALISKLYEEAQELLAAREPDEVSAELADLVEVVRSLCLAAGVDWNDVERSAEAKRQSRGSFANNVVLLTTFWPAWMERSPTDQKPLIDFEELARVSDEHGHHTANFPSLLARRSGATLTLSDGRQINVRLSAKGLEVEELTDSEPSNIPQMEFDFVTRD